MHWNVLVTGMSSRIIAVDVMFIPKENNGLLSHLAVDMQPQQMVPVPATVPDH